MIRRFTQWVSGAMPQTSGASRSARANQPQRLPPRWRAPGVLLAWLVPLACVVGVALPATAGAASKGFHIYNLSGYTLKLVGVTGDGNFEGRPPDGALLPPSAYQDFEVQYVFLGNDQTDIVDYKILGADGAQVGAYRATLHLRPSYAIPTYSECAITIGACTARPLGSTGPGDRTGLTLTVLDPPGTVHDVRTTLEQAAVLKELCDSDGQATCAFNPTSQVAVDSPPHQWGKALENATDDPQDAKVTVKDKVGASDTLGGEVSGSVKILKTVELGLSVKYEHKWGSPVHLGVSGHRGSVGSSADSRIRRVVELGRSLRTA